MMRRPIGVLCGCLVLGRPMLARANEGPPVQRPSAGAVVEPAVVEPAVVEPAPTPVESAPAEPDLARLPSYDAPIVLDEPTGKPKQPFDSQNAALIGTGSVVFSAGVILGLFGLQKWHESTYIFLLRPRAPAILGGVGLTFVATGATLLGVGVTRHKRWKKSLGAPARVQLQPTIGLGQLGVAGRF